MDEQASFDLEITWKAFLLEQVNAPKSRHDDWYAWEDPDFDARDIHPHEAAKSVLHHHGEEAFSEYHRALFKAHHDEDRDLTSDEVLVSIAEEISLNADPIDEDLSKHTFRDEVGTDHLEGENQHGIFGVPTVLFNETQPIFLKLAGGDWEGTDDLEMFRSIYQTAATRSHLLTVKKPSRAADEPPAPPWSGGET